MYAKGELFLSDDADMRSDGGKQPLGLTAALPHSCDKWVIGGKPQVEQLIADLQALLPKLS